ncbi:MAG TPA: hypothetical protein PKE51_03505 [Gemmatimonadaceae bacterium]|nr:hypothetical protein [Gemmatimonadaceae bacterium]
MSTILIPQRRGVLWVLLLVTLALPIAMIVSFGPLVLSLDTPLDMLATGLDLLTRLMPLAIGLYAAFFVFRQLQDPRPLLAIDDLGIRSRSIRDGVLAWRDIAEATVRYETDDATRLELLCLRLRRPSDAATRFDPPHGPLAGSIRRRVARTGLIEINVVWSGHPPEELAAMINARVQRTSSPRPLDAAGSGGSR